MCIIMDTGCVCHAHPSLSTHTPLAPLYSQLHLDGHRGCLCEVPSPSWCVKIDARCRAKALTASVAWFHHHVIKLPSSSSSPSSSSRLLWLRHRRRHIVIIVVINVHLQRHYFRCCQLLFLYQKLFQEALLWTRMLAHFNTKEVIASVQKQRR